MSSLAAARADNFYIDPNRFDPSKRGRGSYNALAKSHPLGDRAKRLGEGILVIRFEMPHDSWCDGCRMHIARGVRFNADKQQVGSYYTTPIWEFRMKCTGCDTHFVIRTDPKNAEYDYVSGISRKVKEFSAVEAGTARGLSEGEREVLASDTFFKLEHKTDDERRAAAVYRQLEGLATIQDARYKDDYASNAKLRAAARRVRAEDVDLAREGAALGLAFPLLPPSQQDAAIAAQAMAAARYGDIAAVAAAVAGAGAALPTALQLAPAATTTSMGADGGSRAGDAAGVASTSPAPLSTTASVSSSIRRPLPQGKGGDGGSGHALSSRHAVHSLLTLASGGGATAATRRTAAEAMRVAAVVRGGVPPDASIATPASHTCTDTGSAGRETPNLLVGKRGRHTMTASTVGGGDTGVAGLDLAHIRYVPATGSPSKRPRPARATFPTDLMSAARGAPLATPSRVPPAHPHVEDEAGDSMGCVAHAGAPPTRGLVEYDDSDDGGER